MKILKVPGVTRSAESGFTIIELIVVILLLGILTATALPRFLDVTDEAHDAVVDAVFGGLTTGTALFRAGYIAQSEPTAGTAITSFGDGTLVNHTSGYPVGNGAGGLTIDANADCVLVFNGLLQQGRPTIAGVDVTGIVPADVTNAGSTDIEAIYDTATVNTCYFAYVGQYSTVAAATAAGDDVPVIVYDASTGSVTTVLGTTL